jgi:protein tyrosine phosphatase
MLPFSFVADFSIRMISESPELKELFADITINQIPDRSLKKEFQLIDLMTLDDSEGDRFIEDPSFHQFHRYSEIRLFSHSLLRPDPSQPHSLTNHLNANFVINPYAQGAGGEVRYIATQGPLKSTSDHFWRMIENHKVTQIVTIVEKEKLPGRCWVYWIPDKAELTEYSLTLIEQSNGAFIDHKTLRVTNLATQASFQVTHYHLHQWIDHLLIKEENYSDYLQFLMNLFLLDQKRPDFRLSVNCSAGVGRTGTFYATYFLFGHFLDCLKANREFTFSIISLVRFLREHRFYAVENSNQYAFLYTFCKLLEKKRSEILAFMG